MDLKKIFFVLYLSSTAAYATDVDPCTGPNELLALVDRPTIGFSACTVPYKKAVLETGYQYQQLIQKGYQQNLPEAEFRLGLPSNTELTILLPNYIHQTVSPHSGFSGASAGLKHEFGFTDSTVYTGQFLIALPSGSNSFGSHGTGAQINAIVSHNLSEHVGVTGMLGVSSLTQSSGDGGGRYSSINPDLVLSYGVNELVLYLEFFGESKTAPDQHSGFMMDTGIVYLLRKNLEVDIEVGQRLSGKIGGFNHYVGAGLSVLFG